MRSTLLALAFTIAVGGLIATAQEPKAPAPQPEPPKQPPVTPAAAASTAYFPLVKGAKWTYKYAEAEVVVKANIDDKGEAKLETFSGDKVVASETLEVRSDGVYRTKINSLDITPGVAGGPKGIKLLDLETKDGKLVPKAKGTKWTVNVKVQAATLQGDYTIVDTEKVAGVDAVRVDAKLNIGGTETLVKYWFAADKGLVKVSYTIANNEQAMELKAYAPDGK